MSESLVLAQLRRRLGRAKAVLPVAVALCAAGSARAATLQVPAQFPTIQAAIDAAVDGDTVQVAAGVYRERITIAKNVAVAGAGRTTTFLGDGAGWPNDAVNISANGAVLSGFDVDGGIIVTSNATIERNAIHNSGAQYYGIYAYGYYSQANPTIQNNVISGCPDGIQLFWSGAIIRNNFIVQNTMEGIDVSWAWPVIENNTIANNGVSGIHNFYYSHAQIRNNVVANNGIYGIVSAYKASAPLHVYNLVGGNAVANYGYGPDSQPIAADPTELNVAAGFVNAPLFTSATAWGSFLVNAFGVSEGVQFVGSTGIGPFVSGGYVQLGRDPKVRTVKSVSGTTVYFNPDTRAQPLATVIDPNQPYRYVNYLGTGRSLAFDWKLSATSPALNAGDPAPEYANVDGSRNTLGATGGPNASW